MAETGYGPVPEKFYKTPDNEKEVCTTVQDLIETLQELPPDLPLVWEGYTVTVFNVLSEDVHVAIEEAD